MKLWNSQAIVALYSIFPCSLTNSFIFTTAWEKIEESIDYNPELRFLNDHTHEADKSVVWCRESQLAT